MKKIAFLVFTLFSTIGFSQSNPNSTYVNGYYKSNGTYVGGYYRSKSNTTTSDNYSTSGNINPYTGRKGYKKYSY